MPAAMRLGRMESHLLAGESSPARKKCYAPAAGASTFLSVVECLLNILTFGLFDHREEDVVGPATGIAGCGFVPGVLAISRIHSGFITELVPPLVRAWRLHIVQRQRIHPQLRQGMQLVGLADAIVVFV